MLQVKELLMKQYDGLPIWVWIAGALLLHLEWWLPRTKLLKANSTLELIPNMLLAMGGRFIPGLSTVLAKMGSALPHKTPPVQSDDNTPTDPAKPPMPMLLPWLLVGTSLVAGCGYCLRPENKATARCMTSDVATKCALPSVAAIVKRILPQVAAALLSGDFDNLLSGIVSNLQQEGVTDAWALLNCAFDQVFSGGAKLSPESYATTKANIAKFKALHPPK